MLYKHVWRKERADDHYKEYRPCFFQNVKKLPVQYCNIKNVWITISIFTECLQEWNWCLNCKIVLLIDNCPGHSKDVNLKNIRIVSLPANTTFLIQACDQGVIRALKAYYRHKMWIQIVHWIDAELKKREESLQANYLAKKTSLLDVVHLLAT